METWTKYTFICDPEGCDALAEYTVKDTYVLNKDVINVTCLCGQTLDLLSVQDATILPIPTKKEEEMITETPAQTMTLDWVENDVSRTVTYSESDIRAMYWTNKNLSNKQSEYFRKESQLRTLLEDVYADSNEQETLAQIAEIFDVPLTKEIEVTAWVRVDMTIEIDIADGDYDIEDMVSNNLNIDSFGSEITVRDHYVERVEEN